MERNYLLSLRKMLNYENFRYLGELSLNEVSHILAESEIFIHTCEPEGFGNNFIQAWFNSCVAVTLEFDPDGIMEKNNIGYEAGDFSNMVDIIKRLMYNNNLRREIGERARKRTLRNHSIEKLFYTRILLRNILIVKI